MRGAALAGPVSNGLPMLDPAGEGRAVLAMLLSRTLGAPVEIVDVHALSGGAASATWRLEASVGGRPRRFIFQRTASADHVGLPRATQAEIQRRAGQLGVPVAAVVAITRADEGLGDGVVTDFVAGEALAPKWLRDPAFEPARARLTAQCADALAILHRAPLATWADLGLPGGSGEALLSGLFDWYRRLGVDIPAFDLAFAWLKPRMPAAPASCLAHGDFRSGNIIVDPGRGLVAVLDWELAHLSVPAEDLGWLCVQAWRFGHWTRPVGGFGTREALLEAYGPGVTLAELHLWEVYGTLKWGLSCLQLADEHLSGRVPSVERAAIGRRVSEVAADIVHLIAHGEV